MDRQTFEKSTGAADRKTELLLIEELLFKLNIFYQKRRFRFRLPTKRHDAAIGIQLKYCLVTLLQKDTEFRGRRWPRLYKRGSLKAGIQIVERREAASLGNV